MTSVGVRGRLWGLILVVATLVGLYLAFFRSDDSLMTVTAYCSCKECCRGSKSRIEGVTYSGKMAHHGTIAADPSVFPMGTRMYVPGYGNGVVEDIGEAIRGRHIDVWFPTHREALKWGVKRLRVRTAKPGS